MNTKRISHIAGLYMIGSVVITSSRGHSSSKKSGECPKQWQSQGKNKLNIDQGFSIFTFGWFPCEFSSGNVIDMACRYVQTEQF